MACHCISWPILGSLSETMIKKITSVFVFDCGNNCFFVTQDDCIYVLGRNGKHSPLGCGSSDFIRQPKRITEFRNEKIINIVAVNGGHVVALCKSGKVFSWSWQNIHGFEQRIPLHMDIGLKFVKIAVGGFHALALSEKGQVVSWGKNQYGQLGNRSTKDCIKAVEIEIHRVYKRFGKIKISFIDIACTASASFFLTSRGRVYSCGYFEAGHGHRCGSTTNTPTQVIYRGLPQLTKIVAAKSAVFAFDRDFNLYSWGSNDHGQCALGKIKHTNVPRKIEVGSKKFFDVGAHCDSDFVAAITTFGEVYVWGSSRFGSLRSPVHTGLITLDEAFIVYDQCRSFRLMGNLITEVDITTSHPPMRHNLTIIIKQERIEVYLIVLYRRSKYFRALIDAGKINDQNCEIHITEYSVQAFKLYIEWIYTGRLNASNLTSDILLELFLLARSLPEPDFLRLLICTCKIVGETEINYKNVVIVYEKAVEEGNEKLIHRCLEFISKNPLYFIFTNAFLYSIKLETSRRLLHDLCDYIDVKALMASVEVTDEIAVSSETCVSLDLEWLAWDDNEDYDDDEYDFHVASVSSETIQHKVVTIEKTVETSDEDDPNFLERTMDEITDVVKNMGNSHDEREVQSSSPEPNYVTVLS